MVRTFEPKNQKFHKHNENQRRITCDIIRTITCDIIRTITCDIIRTLARF